MNLRSTLLELARAVADQADRDHEFAKQVLTILGAGKADATGQAALHNLQTKRARHRRPEAAIDPVEVARGGEELLRSRLAALSLDQLKDVVAEHGMDSGKLVMKWKSRERVIDRIVQISLSRAQKGDAFRAD